MVERDEMVRALNKCREEQPGFVMDVQWDRTGHFLQVTIPKAIDGRLLQLIATLEANGLGLFPSIDRPREIAGAETITLTVSDKPTLPENVIEPPELRQRLLARFSPDTEPPNPSAPPRSRPRGWQR